MHKIMGFFPGMILSVTCRNETLQSSKNYMSRNSYLNPYHTALLHFLAHLSNIGSPDVNDNGHNIGTPAIFYAFSKCRGFFSFFFFFFFFFAMGACAKGTTIWYVLSFHSSISSYFIHLLIYSIVFRVN